jgi:hypothetical protein
MMTESEQKALQLAKRVFEHFTQDALPIAREIIAMEHEMIEQLGNVPTTSASSRSILEIKKTDGPPLTVEMINSSISEPMSLDHPDDYDPAQPVQNRQKDLVYSPADDLPF